MKVLTKEYLEKYLAKYDPSPFAPFVMCAEWYSYVVYPCGVDGTNVLFGDEKAKDLKSLVDEVTNG